MNKTTHFIIIALLTIFTQYGFIQACEKRNIEKLLDLSENV